MSNLPTQPHSFRAKVTPDLGRLIKTSAAVAKQFVPDPRELLDHTGSEAPFESGRETRGIYGLERVYLDRAVLTPVFDCSAYCRYCFKKTRTLAGSGRRMTSDDIDKAIAYIHSDQRIKIVLITGGDPLVDTCALKELLQKVSGIPHVRSIRIGTRDLLFRPNAFTDEIVNLFATFHRVDPERPLQSQTLSVGFSVNHPDELTPDVIRAIQKLVRRGLTVRGQVTLLRDINDNAKTLIELYSLFEVVGLANYYLYHCMPVVGSAHLRTSVDKGLRILREMSHLTGSYSPTYVYVTPVGKHRVGPTSSLTYVEVNGVRYIRSLSPYRVADFLECTGRATLPTGHEADADGFIISHYLDGSD